MNQQTYRFRHWLLEQLRVHQWTQADLAKRTGITRSAISKWLQPVTSPNYRHPSYDTCRILSNVLGVPLQTVLEIAGIEEIKGHTTSLQRKVIALIPHVPDPMLTVLYHQIIPMIDQRIQSEILAALEEQVGHDHAIDHTDSAESTAPQSES